MNSNYILNFYKKWYFISDVSGTLNPKRMVFEFECDSRKKVD